MCRKNFRRLRGPLLFLAPALLSQVSPMPPAARNEATALACNRGAVTGEDRKRQEALTRQLLGAVSGKRELADGYAFRLAGMPLPAIAEWVTLERRCCGFFEFRIDVPRRGNSIWLRLTGPAGVKEFMRANFSLAPQATERTPR